MISPLILTGFEPFAEHPINPSQQVVDWFHPQAEELGLVCMTLPVRAKDMPGAVEEICALRPRAVVALGLGGGAAIHVERVAVNLADFRIPDTDTHQPVDQTIIPSGPHAYLSTLPVREITDTLLQQGIPATISNTAGTYLCNMLLYSLLHATRASNIPVGFIHLPQTPEMVARQLRLKPTTQIPPSMSLEMLQRAVGTILKTIR